MLTSDIDRYLELRRSMGFKLIDTERCLRGFARFADQRGDTYLRSQTAVAWAACASTARRRDKRMIIVIGFARFLRAEDFRHEIPPRDTVCCTYPRPAPYIFSPEEIQRLGQAAARLGPPRSLRPHTFSTLFNLLAVTGLRIREALTLKIEDFTPDGLVVRKTKFHKSRAPPFASRSNDGSAGPTARSVLRDSASRSPRAIATSLRCICATPAGT